MRASSSWKVVSSLILMTGRWISCQGIWSLLVEVFVTVQDQWADDQSILHSNGWAHGPRCLLRHGTELVFRAKLANNGSEWCPYRRRWAVFGEQFDPRS